jgi:eukaryotic-like serine/threonine-protein kinase
MNLGRYTIVKQVGKGAMGVVYQAHDPQIDRMVALKVLRKDRISGESFVKRFIKEAKVVGRFSHPNIVTIYDIGQEQEDVYIAMEFIEGEPLNEILLKKKFSLDEVISLGIQMAETLDYAHEKGVVHRDIKPSNIILQPHGKIKITDFGIAHIDDSSSTLLTMEGEIMGTPSYMSPEQVLGEKADSRSDIFSLGVVLYELSSGKRPFGGEGKNLGTIFNEIINIAPQEPFLGEGIMPKGLSGVVMKCLNKSRDDRYQRGNDLAEALKKCCSTEVPVATAPSKKKNRTVPLIASLVLFVSVGAFLFFYLTPGMKTIDQKAPKASAIQGHASPAHGAAVSQTTPVAKAGAQRTDIQGKAEEPKSVREGTVEPPSQEKTASVINKTGDQDTSSRAASSSTPAVISEKLSRKPINSEPVTQEASLDVSSIPKGADLIINGKFEGKTPIQVKLSPGKYKVALHHTDYQRWERQITLTRQKKYPIHAQLKPVPKNDGWIIKPAKDL